MTKILTKLWDHQRQLVDFAQKSINDRGFAWWLSGCGTGKTLAAFSLFNVLGVDRTLIITKKSIIDQVWTTTANERTEGFFILPLSKGTSSDKWKLLKSHKNTKNLVVVISYETASILSIELSTMRFDAVLSDESHKLKAHNSGLGKNLSMLANSIPIKVAMTATGWDDRPTDVFGQVRYLGGAYKVSGGGCASRILGNWTSFFDQYVIYRTMDNIKIPIKYKNLDHLRSIIDPFTMYLNSEEVLTLPPQQDISWKVSWTPTLKKLYRDLEVDMLAEYGGSTLVADNALVLGLRLHQLTGGYLHLPSGGEFIATPKLDATLDILDEIGGEPTVIFTVFETDVQMLKPKLEEAGYKVLLLTGSIQEHQEFQQGSGDVIIVNLAAGNAGIELTRARYVIYYSIGNSRTNYSQSRYRVRRPGSDVAKTVTYYHLVLPMSVDEDLHRAMQGKGEVSEYLLEGLINRVK